MKLLIKDSDFVKLLIRRNDVGNSRQGVVVYALKDASLNINSKHIVMLHLNVKTNLEGGST